MVHPYHGILPTNIKEETIDTCNNLNDSPEKHEVMDYIIFPFFIFLSSPKDIFPLLLKREEGTKEGREASK